MCTKWPYKTYHLQSMFCLERKKVLLLGKKNIEKALVTCAASATKPCVFHQALIFIIFIMTTRNIYDTICLNMFRKTMSLPQHVERNATLICCAKNIMFTMTTRNICKRVFGCAKINMPKHIRAACMLMMMFTTYRLETIPLKIAFP